jgi:hypothetical protein
LRPLSLLTSRYRTLVVLAGALLGCGGALGASTSEPGDAGVVNDDEEQGKADAARPGPSALPPQTPCDPGGYDFPPSIRRSCEVVPGGPRTPPKIVTCDGGACVGLGGGAHQCVPFTHEREPCFAASPRAFTCAPDLHCHEPTNSCAAAGDIGAWCRESSQCRPGFYCTGQTSRPDQPATIACHNEGICQPVKKRGEPCVSLWQCPRGLYCRTGICE